MVEFNWRQFPETQQWVDRMVRTAVDALPFLNDLESRLQTRTGTQLGDWIDCLELGRERVSEDELLEFGFERFEQSDADDWHHSGGLFPRIRLVDGDPVHVALKVESVSNFLFVHRLPSAIDGAIGGPIRRALVAEEGTVALSVIERHGCLDFYPSYVNDNRIAAANRIFESFLLRQRDFDTEEQGFDEAIRISRMAIDEIGIDWACSLFFAAERDYWQSRNRAARMQAERQNVLGFGWANHDHHTYRCSREHFARLVEVLELLGMECRERFYGGAEAGWGAQVLEQSVAGIVVFADVDLSAEELSGDFAHNGLEPQPELGTVGLWCKLHGEAILQAGMHHLECQFSFLDAREQLNDLGVESMAPFTDFDHLKQSFTKGERWQVAEKRLQSAIDRGWIDRDQADRFRKNGSIGSHLEILQRWNGYKGFNQTGISEIIRKTDPRQQA
ncbi:MAG: hypothetical protein AAGG48_18890 [Planctomycetota bacterium]